MEPTIGLVISFSSFLFLFLAIGAIATRTSSGTDQDYLLGNRSFGRWVVGLSAGATANTSFILIAAVALGYTSGLSLLLLFISAFIGDLFFWTFLAKHISQRTEKSGSATVAELATSNLQPNAAASVRSIISLIIFFFVGAYIIAQFGGSAKILNAYFGIDTSVSVLIAAAAILAYCTTGGLRASMWTDFVQAILMIALVLGVTGYAIFQVGGPITLIDQIHTLDPSFLSLTQGHTLMSGIAFVIGYILFGLSFGLSSPQITVRIMAGQSSKEVLGARWIYLAFHYGLAVTMIIFGMCCRLLMPEIADAEQALPLYTATVFPPWLVGLVLAGMFSTIASSADSQILVTSSALGRDFLPKFSSRMTRKFGVRYQQFITLTVGIAAAYITIQSSSTVFDLVVFSISVMGATLGAAMLIYLLDRPTSATALNTAMLTGVTVALTWRWLGWHNFIVDLAPGMLATLLTHEAIIRLTNTKTQTSALPTPLKKAANH